MITLTSILSILVFTPLVSWSFSKCRCLPGDSCWPSPATWSQFNASISGRLIATIPLGVPCHGANFDETQCGRIRDEWNRPEIHYQSSSSTMDPYFANGSCDPFHAKDTPCSLGDFVVYTVNVSVPDHITKTLQFVAEHNIRLVIRNTGHDYLGKSTGTGALGLWMHHLHDINISDYRDAHYNGKAITVGAGVMAFEAYRAADAQGLQVVGGECPTVGIAGGYTQGGGHSLLSSRHGLAADQVLSWEVVLANGELVTATRDNKHADLYWALSGGGGGTYGVVWSMTAKAHPDTPVSGLNLTFSSEGVDKELFYYAASLFHETLPALVDAGVMCVTILTQTTFEISPMAGPDIPVSELLDLLEPFTDDLEDLGIQYAIFANQFPGFLSQHQAMMPPVPVESVQLGSWLVPREVVVSNSEGLTAAWRRIVEDGATVLNVGLNVSKAVAGDVDNAVLPAWRDALVHSAISTTWEWEEDDKMRELERKMTDVYIPEMVRLAPESGAYMNEADLRQPDFQKAFYGANYARLRDIKKKYDPNDLFYASTAVGSDDWTESAEGRLCRV